jgi:catechol 2,3-dioxygenase-like lactoylglutathione lyase family enzyme
MRCELDHLVVGCADLEQGAAWLCARLGVEPQPGGRHAAMGTHNRLLALGARTYLELIAIDPQALAPGRPRWFDLDAPAVRERLAVAPRLIAWVVRCDDIAAAVARVPALGRVHALTRGDYAWRIAIPDDGARPFDGVLPAVIQWDGRAHPADGLEPRGCALAALELAHPDEAALRAAFRELRITGRVELRSGPPALRARLLTPAGDVEIC